MKLEMLAILREQAENLLMVMPGQFEFSPIEYCKGLISEVYQQFNRNPPQDNREMNFMIHLLAWLAACEWWSIIGPKDDPDPADYGIFAVGGTEKHKHLKVYCHDYTHYKSLPKVVNYRGVIFGCVMWEADSRRATYRNDVPSALGIV